MIAMIKNDDGYPVGVIDWYILGQDGQFKVQGEFIYISDVWTHEKINRYEVLAKLVDIVDKHPYSHSASKVYWDTWRDKDGNKVTDDKMLKYANRKQSGPYLREYILAKILRSGLRKEFAKC